MLIDYGQEPDKITVTLIFEDKESKVSWCPKDTNLKDAKFMFLCTCDALADCEFEVLDMQAKPVNINLLMQFTNNSVFFIRRSQTNKVSNLLMDGRRRLFVEIEPLRHIEAQIAIKYMCIGSNLLKHTKKGFPHIRLFQLSNDFQRILWYTKSKKITEAQVLISSIKDLTIGQISDTFIQYPLKMLEDFSFSIYYNPSSNNNSKEIKTLDITCKDIKEFDLWVIGIKALHSHQNSKVISKNDLLRHSKSYEDHIKKGSIGTCTKFLFYNSNDSKDKGAVALQNSKTLDNFLLNRDLSPYAISQVLLRLNNKLQALHSEIEEYTSKDTTGTAHHHNNNDGDDDGIDGNDLGYEGYQQVFAEEAIVDDLDTQKSQMITLYDKCEKGIVEALEDFFCWYEHNTLSNYDYSQGGDKETFANTMTQLRFHYDSYLPSSLKRPIALDQHDDEGIMCDNGKIHGEFFMKELDIRTWKIEVDLENVGDILNRFNCLKNRTFIDSMKDMFKGMIK